MLTVSVNLDVPPLPENDVWFLNAAAWTNYWANIGLTGTFNPTANTAYAEQPYDNTTQGITFNYGGVQYDLPSQAQFDSLLAAYQALNTDYKALKATLVAIGLITQV